MLRDQIVDRAASTKIQELLMIEKNLTLERAIEIARSVESAVRECSAQK